MVKYNDMTGEQQAEVRKGHRAAKAARAALDAKNGITGVTTTSTATGQKKGPKSTPKPGTTTKTNAFKGKALVGQDLHNIVIDHDKPSILSQFREYKKGLSSVATNKGAYGLDIAIETGVGRTKASFMPAFVNVQLHSNIVPTRTGGVLDGGNAIVCFDPVLKQQLDIIYNMELKTALSNWNQYQRNNDALLSTAIGNVHPVVLTACESDPRYTAMRNNNDLMSFLEILQAVCTKSTSGQGRCNEEFEALKFMKKIVNFVQSRDMSDIDYGQHVEDQYDALVHTLGPYALGWTTWNKVLSEHPTPRTFQEYVALSESEQAPYKLLVKGRFIALLMIGGTVHGHIRTMLNESYAVHNTSCYPTDKSATLKLFASLGSSKPKVNTAVVAMHEAVESEDSHISDDDTNEAVISIIDEIEESENTMALVMAQVLEESEADLVQSKDDTDLLFPQILGQQNVSDAFDNDEPNNIIAVHIACTTSLPPIDYPIDWTDDERILTIALYKTSEIVNSSPHPCVEYINNPHNRAAEKTVDWMEAVMMKLKVAGLHTASNLLNIIQPDWRTPETVANNEESTKHLNSMLHTVGCKGFHTSTVELILKHCSDLIRRYQDDTELVMLLWNHLNLFIGDDEPHDTNPYNISSHPFPPDTDGMRWVLSRVAAKHNKHHPNKWTNMIIRKLVHSGITGTELFVTAARNGTINHDIRKIGKSTKTLHQITCKAILDEVNSMDFQRGRL